MVISISMQSNSDSSKRADLYANAMDRSKHLAYIIAIAHENGRAVPEVAEYYERILGDLKNQALIHDYLNVFVSKKVSEQLKALH